jgi:hypothetical protein
MFSRSLIQMVETLFAFCAGAYLQQWQALALVHAIAKLLVPNEYRWNQFHCFFRAAWSVDSGRQRYWSHGRSQCMRDDDIAPTAISLSHDTVVSHSC